MPRIKKAIVRCEKCISEFAVSESFARNMKFCPACSCMLKPSREDIKKDIMLWVYTYIEFLRHGFCPRYHQEHQSG